MSKSEFEHVPLSDIEISKTNTMFRDETDFQGPEFDELVSSIDTDGVIQPILIRRLPSTKKYELVCGERRYRASVKAKKQTIPAYIQDLTDEKAIELQIIENLKRKDINPIKEAHAYLRMQKDLKFSAAEIAKRIVKSPDYVEERLRLNKLNPEVQDYVRKGVLPLKAALKIARIPDHLHIEALKECTTTIDGASGKSIVFTGLESLQDWLNYNVFNDLANAEWDKEDTKLVPSAGSCVACTQRTKNAGGLFDDIAKNDLCLNGGCFRSKMTATYLRLKEELKAKHPEVEISFKARGYSKDGLDQKKIAPIMPYDQGSVISEKQAKNDKNAKLVIYVGEAYTHGGTVASKKFDWVTTSKIKPQKVEISPKAKAAIQSDKDSRLKVNKLQYYQDSLMIQEFQKKMKVLPVDLLRISIAESISLNVITLDDLLPVLQALEIDFELTARKGAKPIKCTSETDVAELLEGDYYMSDTHSQSFLAKANIEQLNTLFAWILYGSVYKEKTTILKVLKVDSKAITAKAKEKTATWWKEEQAKRVKDAAPAAAGKKESPVKKSLSSLLKKK